MEHDWLHQRRYGYDEIYDPWAPEEREQRRRDSLEREDMRRSGDPLDADDPDWTDDGKFVPDHDRT